MIKAVFLDRDGTIIVDKHYMHKVEEIEYYADTFSFLKEVQLRGYEIFMVTNQSGIGRGYFKEEQMHEVHEQIQKDIVDKGLKPFKAIKFCPDHPNKEDTFRKPSPQMINELALEFDIDLAQSYMIGDKDIDALSGENAGCIGIHLQEKTLSDCLEIIK